MPKMRPLSSGKPKAATGAESQAAMGFAATSFDELHDKFVQTVSGVLAAENVRIAPTCRSHFTGFIDSGVSHLINSHASSREVAAAENRLRQFTLHTVEVARSRGKIMLDVQTFRISKAAGRWCPPFCGDDDE